MSHFYKRRSRFQSNPSASRIPVYYIIEVIGFVFGVIVILDDFGTNKQPTSLTTTIADQEIKGFIKMPELDLDNFEEILARSQVEDLIRCKSVCKSWNSLISSHRFVKSHLNYNLKKKANNEIGDIRIDLNGKHSYYLVGSSDGLVCIYHRFEFEFFVVNPSTREVKELRNFPPQDNIGNDVYMGFGYDSSIDDFKVVVGLCNEYSHNFVFNVLTLKSNVWRTVAAGEVGDYPAVKYGTLCNGMIHWLCSDRIVSFDLSKEVIIEIPIPDQLDRLKCYGYTSTLGTIKDRLCIIYKDKCWDKKIEERIEIWVLKNYNVMKTEGIEIEQWLPPPGYDEHKTKMKYTPHEDFFYGHVHIWMLEEGSGAPVLVHSFESPGHNTHIKLSTISECNYNFDRPVYVKSLVSPNGMGDDDSGNGGRLESKGNTSSSSLDHCHTKSCETLEECHTICNKSQRFAKISKICKNLKDLQKSHKTKKHL